MSDFIVNVFKSFGITQGLIIVVIIGFAWFGWAVYNDLKTQRQKDNEQREKEREEDRKSRAEERQIHRQEMKSLMDLHTKTLNQVIQDTKEEKEALLDSLSTLAENYSVVTENVKEINRDMDNIKNVVLNQSMLKNNN